MINLSDMGVHIPFVRYTLLSLISVFFRLARLGNNATNKPTNMLYSGASKAVLIFSAMSPAPGALISTESESPLSAF